LVSRVQNTSGERIKELTDAVIHGGQMHLYDLGFLENADFGKWRIEKDLCQCIGTFCERLKPRRVLEFGSGLSTLVLAQEVSKGNIQEVISIDHLADFPGHPREVIVQKGLERVVRFYSFPVAVQWFAGKLLQFYAIPDDFYGKVGQIDLVIIDGPPYFYNGREAALYSVFPSLSLNAIVLLDDAKRKDKEQRYLANWKSYLDGQVEVENFLNEFKKGLGVVTVRHKGGKTVPFSYAERFSDSFRSLKLEAQQKLLVLAKHLLRRKT
jgi:predicted O-methyltransferase YrrM